ncbi:MAG: hypothetical protein ACREXR_12175, partial [Gammaproteobacteria bacterium]
RDVGTLQAVHQFEELWVNFIPDALKHRRLSALCKKHNIKVLVIPESDPYDIAAVWHNSAVSHYVSQ